jgi:uncharacterized protein YbgA (DUF1722 family)/uncharacterized protein YbbK (DUF523 family)
MNETIKIGISSCLLGEKVRFDGGHKLDRFIRDTLGQYVTFVPVCPEVMCGFPIPRETLRLVGDPQNPRLVTTKTNIDHTERMQSWARTKLDALEKENLCGFIFKKDSPSSGLLRVKVYNASGMPEKKGRGIFAKAFTDRFPRVPVEEEGRLNDPLLRENFIERLFALRRWRSLLEKQRRIGHLVNFHTNEKLLILAHSPSHYRLMGKLVADSKKIPANQLYDTYEKMFVEALQLKATTAKNMNALQHIMGYFKKNLTRDEKTELLEIINDYRKGYVPLVVPVTLVNHYVRKYEEPYLGRQTYLRPHPVALKLRNHA